MRKTKKPQQHSLGLDTYNSDEDSTLNSASEDHKPKKKTSTNKRSQEEIKNKIVALTKKRKQEGGEKNEQINTPKSDQNFDSFKSYIYLPCKFMDNMNLSIESLMRDVLYRDPYNFLLFSPCSTADPFFVGYHVSLSKTFHVKKNIASELRSQLEKSMSENVKLPIKVAFKSISMYLGSNGGAKSDITPTYAIYLAFDLSDECEQRITSFISKPFSSNNSTNDSSQPLIDEKNLWFSKMHVSFACRLFKDRESQIEYYKQCLKHFTKVENQDDYPTSFKICSIQTAAQHLMGTNLSQTIQNRVSASDARKDLLSSTPIESIEIVMGVKTFSIPIPKVREPQTVTETWQITVSFSQ